MDAPEAVHRLGGTATRGSIVRLVPARNLERAIESGTVIRDVRGRYSLPSVTDAVRAANRLTGVVSHVSAAQHWGWEVKTPPPVPHVTVPRKRRVSVERRRRINLHWADLAPDDTVDGVTGRARTLTDCLTTCPFDEALAIADSALRHGSFTSSGLVALTAPLRGPGSASARRVAALADPRAANPFESVLRALCRDIRGLHPVPQVPITGLGFYARPDLVDSDLRVVLEADSHTWHSSRAALRRDCRRYNALVLRGWTVLRFAWEDVMFEPDSVRNDLSRFVEQAQRPQKRRQAR